MPTITEQVTIDGTSAGGYVATPVIQIDGAGAGNTANGLRITGNASTVTALSITRFDYDGVRIEGGDGNIVRASWLGVDTSGLAAGNHGYGVDILGGASSNDIGGVGANGNVISANGNGSSAPGGPFCGVGVFDAGSNDNVIRGNLIGTDTAGGATAGYGNFGLGVLARDASTTFIGVGGAGNVISGNAFGGILLDNETADSVTANIVGLAADGATDLGNGGSGITVLGGTVDIGAASPGSRNVISGNAQDGIELSGGTEGAFTVVGNNVGTNAAGTAIVKNDRHGILLNGTTEATIGGDTALERNLISGNGTITGIVPSQDAIQVTGGGDANVIQGNRIGTNAAGTAALANANYGIHVWGATNTVIGGTASTTPGGACTGECNLISGSGKYAVLIENNASNLSSGTTVLGNMLGTDVNGTAATSERDRRRAGPQRPRDDRRIHRGCPQRHLREQRLGHRH